MGFMTVGELRKVIFGVRDEFDVRTVVVSAPFDDEEVEIVGIAREVDHISLRVAVVDDVTREIRLEDERF